MNRPTLEYAGKKVLCVGKKVLCVEKRFYVSGKRFPALSPRFPAFSRAFPRSFLNTKMREKVSRGAEKVYAR